MQISNKDILIRRATQHDATLLTTWWNDGKIMAHAGFPHGIHTSVEEVIQQLITDNKKRLIIEYQHQPIGEMCYFSHSSQHVYETLGFQIYDIQHDYWQDPQGQMHSAIFYELFPSTFISTKKL